MSKLFYWAFICSLNTVEILNTLPQTGKLSMGCLLWITPLLLKDSHSKVFALKAQSSFSLPNF